MGEGTGGDGDDNGTGGDGDGDDNGTVGDGDDNGTDGTDSDSGTAGSAGDDELATTGTDFRAIGGVTWLAIMLMSAGYGLTRLRRRRGIAENV